jgi:hypothetical protein
VFLWRSRAAQNCADLVTFIILAKIKNGKELYSKLKCPEGRSDGRFTNSLTHSND